MDRQGRQRWDRDERLLQQVQFIDAHQQKLNMRKIYHLNTHEK